MSEPYESLLMKMPMFAGITSYGATLLLERGEVKRHPAGDKLFKEGDPADSVLLILTGKLEAYIERDGAELSVSQFAPGTIVGDVAVFCGLRRTLSARALEPSAVLYWPADAYRSL